MESGGAQIWRQASNRHHPSTTENQIDKNEPHRRVTAAPLGSGATIGDLDCHACPIMCVDVYPGTRHSSEDERRASRSFDFLRVSCCTRSCVRFSFVSFIFNFMHHGPTPRAERPIEANPRPAIAIRYTFPWIFRSPSRASVQTPVTATLCFGTGSFRLAVVSLNSRQWIKLTSH